MKQLGISADLKGRVPRIPWQDVVTMRNKITHEYWGTDVKIVWDTAKLDLPILRVEIQKLLDSLLEGYD